MRKGMITIVMPYNTTEQLKTVLLFLEPITLGYKKKKGIFGGKKRAYITIQV